MHTSPTPIIIENQSNHNTKRNYGGVDIQNPYTEYRNESMYALKGRYLKGTTAKVGIVNVALVGYTGLFNFKHERSKTEFYYGVGPEMNAALTVPIEKFRFGLGANINFNLEAGSYYNFRRSIGQGQLVNMYLSLFYVMSLELENGYVISTQCNLGFPGVFSPMAALNTGKNIFWIGWKPPEAKSWIIDNYNYTFQTNDFHPGHFMLGYMISI